jgi:hypothetical protein
MAKRESGRRGVPGRDELARGHPAEKMTVAGAAGFLLARVLGLDDPSTMTALTVTIAFIPAAVTWLVDTFRPEAADRAAGTSPALAPVLEQLAETAASALTKARQGEDWQEEIDALRAVTEALAPLDRESRQ